LIGDDTKTVLSIETTFDNSDRGEKYMDQVPILDYVPDKTIHLVDYAPYWKSKVKPRGFKEFCEMFDEPHMDPWELKNFDRHTGDINQLVWAKNTITDNGAISMLKNTWNNAGSAVGIMNHIVISPNGCSTTITSATGTSAITTLSVAALPAALADNDQLTIGYGGANPQTVQVNNGAGYAIGATSITIDSFTPPVNYPIGTALVLIPKVTDNPSSVSGSQDSGALSGGAFTFNATTGLGNRNVVIVYTFVGTSGNAGTYREAYTSNAGTIASNSTASHVIFPGFVLDASTNEQITLTEKT